MSRTKKIIINVGIPGSGKTTESLKYIEKNPNCVIVSRDGFRKMFGPTKNLESKGESAISRLVLKTSKEMLRSGYDVIIDACHCRKKYITEIINELSEYGEISFSVFYTDLETCIKRDSLRESPVGEEIIKEFYKEFLSLLSITSFQKIPQKSRIKPDYSSLWKKELPDVIITDIDGTVAHMNARRGPFEWDKVDLDSPDIPVITALQAWEKAGYKIIAVSGRSNVCRDLTEKWLKTHNVPFSELFMRDEKDMRKDSLVKKDIYLEHLKDKYNIILCYDDRDQVVDLWRSLGIKCAQVEPGDF
jgi:predicted kinase